MKRLAMLLILSATSGAVAQTTPAAPPLRAFAIPEETAEAKRQETLRLGVTACMRMQTTHPELAASDDCKLLRQKWDETVQSNIKLQGDAASKQIKDAVDTLKR
jgi:hypothetical protein